MRRIAALFLFFTLVISGCDWNTQTVQQGLVQIAGLFGIQRNSKSGSAETPNASAQTEDQSGFESKAAKNAKANAEILREILLVVFMREPQNRSEFGQWSDTLNQGASLEGVYRGIIQGSEFRKLERTTGSSSAEALRVFGEELFILEADLPVPTQWMTQELIPQALAMPTSVPTLNGQPVEVPRPTAEYYSRKFVNSSIYSLKRILGEEALKVMSVKSEYHEKLALWYSKWAVRVCHLVIGGTKVDFGINLRNQSDEAFHYKWAIEATDDRIQWEVLNRLHRILNHANQQRQ